MGGEGYRDVKIIGGTTGGTPIDVNMVSGIATVTLVAEDIEIGAVEIKNGTSDARLTINPDGTADTRVAGVSVTVNTNMAASSITLNVNVAASAITINSNIVTSAITFNTLVVNQTLTVVGAIIGTDAVSIVASSITLNTNIAASSITLNTAVITMPTITVGAIVMPTISIGNSLTIASIPTVTIGGYSNISTPTVFNISCAQSVSIYSAPIQNCKGFSIKLAEATATLNIGFVSDLVAYVTVPANTIYTVDKFIITTATLYMQCSIADAQVAQMIVWL